MTTVESTGRWLRHGRTIVLADPDAAEAELSFEVARTALPGVRWVQAALNLILDRGLAEDGSAGTQTRTAIRDFQTAHGLVGDGVAGPQTAAALRQALLTLPTEGPPCAAVGRPAEELVGFAFDDARLQPAHLVQIGTLARCAATARPESVRVVGHTDPVGDDSYNLTLGLHRAEEVTRAFKEALDRHSPGATARMHIEVDTRGEAEQIPGSPEQNRRVQVFVPLAAPPPQRPRPQPRPAPRPPAVPAPPSLPPVVPVSFPPPPAASTTTSGGFTLPADPSKMRPPARQLVGAAFLFPPNDVIDTMADLLTTVAARPDGWAYLANWWIEDDLRVPRGGTLADRLRLCASKGATLRGLFWAGLIPSFDDLVRDRIPPALRPFVPRALITAVERAFATAVSFIPVASAINRKTAAFIESLPRSPAFIQPWPQARAFVDSDTLPAGSHHHKILVVGNSDVTTAVVGGVDWNTDRITTVRAGTPLFDTSVRFDGPAAADVATAFEDRWNANPVRKAIKLPTRITPIAPEPNGGPSVQIGVNYGCGHPFRDRGFAIVGGSELIENVLKKCRGFFYLECQYGFGNDNIRRAIDAAFANGARFGIVVLAGLGLPDTPPGTAFRRHQFWSRFPQIDKQLLVFERAGDDGRPGGPHAYVHSKLALVDDRALSVGTFNLSRRSWRHDSEITAVIAEAPRLIRSARVRLWKEHLTLRPTEDVGDPGAAFSIWREVHRGTRPMPRIRPRPFLGVPVPPRPVEVRTLLPRFVPPATVAQIQAAVDSIFDAVVDPESPAVCPVPAALALTAPRSRRTAFAVAPRRRVPRA